MHHCHRAPNAHNCSRDLLPTGLLALTLISSLAAPATAGTTPSEHVPGELIVGIRSDVDTAKYDAPEVGDDVAHQSALHAHRIKLRTGVTLAQAMAALRKRSDVTFVEPNYIRHGDTNPDDPLYPAQWAPPLIRADKAWTIANPKQQIIVAVLDTGVDGTNPDLRNKILRSGGAIEGYNSLTSVPGTASDDNGHGTHCAGIVAAEVNNGIDVAGIAGCDTAHPVLVMPVKVMDSSMSTNDGALSDGITWAVDHGAKVITMSLGGPSDSAMLDQAMDYAWSKGCILVASAGNAGSSTPQYPAANVNVLGVAATNSSDAIDSWSNHGSWVAVAAPGDTILSTLPMYAAAGNFGIETGYMSGTSMAAPHVAAEAALIMAQNPSLTNSQVRSLIISNTDPYTGNAIQSGSGRINIYRALEAATPSGGSTPNPITVAAAADTYVRGGAYASKAMGAPASLYSCKASGATSAADMATYIQFDLTHVTSAPRSAVLSLYTTSGCAPIGATTTLTVAAVSGTPSLTALTLNSAPSLNVSTFASTGTTLGTVTIVDKTSQWITINLGSSLEQYAGKVVTLQVMGGAADGVQVAFQSHSTSHGEKLALSF